MLVNDKLRLLDHLKSMVIELSINSNGTDYEIGTNNLIQWIKVYDKFFKEKFEIDVGKNISTLYDRQISFHGEGLTHLPQELKLIIKQGIDLGFAISITVGIEELHQNYALFKNLCDNSLLSSIAIIINDDFDRLGKQYIPIEDFLIQIAELERPITFVASVKVMKKLNIFSNKSMNKSGISILVTPDNFSTKVPSFPILSCAERFSLYIDYKGYIYPCIGLVGLDKLALGDIKKLSYEIKLNREEYPLDLIELMKNGPKLPISTNKERLSTLPWVCEQHRLELFNE